MTVHTFDGDELAISAGDAQVIADLAARAAAARDLEGAGQLLVTDKDGRPAVVTFNDEQLLPRPHRARGAFLFRTPAGFIDYVKTHQGIDGTTIWSSLAGARLTAVLNDHDSGVAGWGDHRATLQLAGSPEWNAWCAHDGKLLGQVDFAEYLEEHLADIVSPPAAQMVDIARRFEATKGLEFKSGKAAQSGETQLTYIETVQARAGQQGELEIPQKLELGIAPFDGGELYRITARFRYRINDGTLKLRYQLDRPDLVRRAAFAEIVATCADQLDLKVYDGTPANPVQAAAAAVIDAR